MHPAIPAIIIIIAIRTILKCVLGISQIMPPSDLVIHYPDANIIGIIELTVPCETNIEEEHTFKTNKYATLI